jgi:hypothetical protein
MSYWLDIHMPDIAEVRDIIAKDVARPTRSDLRVVVAEFATPT